MRWEGFKGTIATKIAIENAPREVNEYKILVCVSYNKRLFIIFCCHVIADYALSTTQEQY